MEVKVVVCLVMLPLFLIGFAVVFCIIPTGSNTADTSSKASNTAGTSSAAIIPALIFAFIIAFGGLTLFSVPAKFFGAHKARKNEERAKEELTYFRAALSGKYSKEEISHHYAWPKVSYLGTATIEKVLRQYLDDQDLAPKLPARPEVNPTVIPVLLQAFKDTHLPRFLIALSETPPNLKKEWASSQEQTEDVIYLARSQATPPEVLTVLVKHRSGEVRETACGNKSTPKKAKRLCPDTSSTR